MIDNTINLSGKVIGTCVLESLIGRGGMSVVYRAQQVQPVRRQLAIKILLPEAPIGSKLHNQFLARFQREAHIIANLHHDHIIPLYEYDEQDGEAYLVMPYLTGGSLSKVLALQGVLTLQETLNYIEQASEALDYAHKNNVIHRDLKPSNFLLDSARRLVLADFGIARIIRTSDRTIFSTLTNPGVVLGTPDYMSPEMVQGEPVDNRSDIYALGIVLFQMLRGEVPFKGSTPVIFAKHVHEPLPLLHPMNPGIPPAVDDVIQKATAKRREDRFTSPGDMAKALRTAITVPYDYSKKSMVNAAPTLFAPMGSPSTFDPYAITSYQSTTSKTVEEYPREFSGSNKSSTALKLPRQKLPIVLMIIAFMIAISAISFEVWNAGSNEQSKPPNQPVSLPSQSEQAKATVQQYYDYWNQGKYQDAYNLLSSDYRKDHSFDSLYGSYIATKYVSIQITQVTLSADGSYDVRLIDIATEMDPSGTTATRKYNGYYIVKLENGFWTLYPHFIY
jgi:serine/threonine protein kinase